MNILGVIGILGAIFGIIAALAAATVIAKSNYFKAQIEALRGDREDLKERSDFQQGEILRLTTENESMKKRMQLLENMVTARDLITELKNMIRTVAEESKQRQEQIISLLEGARDAR